MSNTMENAEILGPVARTKLSTFLEECAIGFLGNRKYKNYPLLSKRLYGASRPSSISIVSMFSV